MRSKFVAVLLSCGCSTGLGGEGDDSVGLGASEGSGSGTTTGTGTATSAADSSDGPSGPTSTVGADSSGSGAETTEGAGPCGAHWRVPRSDGDLNAIGYDPALERVYAAGTLPTSASWVMAIDACDGAVLADVEFTHPAADGDTRIQGLTLLGGEVVVAGSVELTDDPLNGLFAGLDPDDLSTAWSQSLYGSPGADEVRSVTSSADGNLWMSGVVSTSVWAVAGSLGGGACGFGAGTPSGSGRAIAADGEELVVAARTSALELVILRYDQACTCMCMPTFVSDPIVIGDDTTNVGGMVVVDGQYYVAGWTTDAADPGNIYGYVAWVSSTGALIEVYTTDLGPEDDGFFTLGTDGERLYAGGTQNWTGEAMFVDSTAVLQAIALPFGAAPQAEWSAVPTDVDTITDIEAGAAGLLYVGGNIDGDGVVLRCDELGDCG